jgi:hypothetical protein
MNDGHGPLRAETRLCRGVGAQRAGRLSPRVGSGAAWFRLQPTRSRRPARLSGLPRVRLQCTALVGDLVEQREGEL